MSTFKSIYWVGIIIEMAIRAPLRKTWKESAKSEQRISPTEKVLHRT